MLHTPMHTLPMTRTKQASVAAAAVHLFTLEVGRKGTLAIGAVLERLVAVRTESTRKHGDVAEHTLQRLVQDVRHLVLEVLRCGERALEQEVAVTASVNANPVH